MKPTTTVFCSIALAMATFASAQDPAAPVESDPTKPPRNEESSVNLTTPEPRSLVGTRVQTPSGEQLGTIEEVLVDEANGREFMLLKIGADKYAAMPKAAVSLLMRDKVLVLDRERLAAAPTLGADWRKHVPNDAYLQSDRYWTDQKHSSQGPPPPERR